MITYGIDSPEKINHFLLVSRQESDRIQYLLLLAVRKHCQLVYIVAEIVFNESLDKVLVFVYGLHWYIAKV